jgi:predicted oxidoreductase
VVVQTSASHPILTAVADLAVADSQVVLADIDNKKNINPKALTTRFGIFFVYSQQI